MSDSNSRWSLPSYWIWTTIGEVADVIGGGTPATSNSNNFGGSIPWITPADMSNHTGKLIDHGARSLTEQGMEGSGARLLPKGTVLFSSRAPIGYVAIASQPLTTNQGFKSFVPTNGIISEYLHYWLSSAKPLAEELASGTTFLELSGAKAALIPLPLTPTNEQSRIVEKLDELLSDLDAGVAELKAAQKKLAQYRQSLLKSAVEGSLTSEWRTKNKPKETGAQLLERVLKERRTRWEEKQLAKFKEQGKTPSRGWQDKYPEPVQPDTANLPELPEGWVWASVDQICPDDIANGKSVPTTTSGPKVLRLTAVKAGRIDLGEFKYGVWSDRDAEPFFVKNGDVLIVRGNGSLSLVGRAGLVSGVTSDIAYPDTMIRVRVLHSIVLPAWLSLVWNSALIRDHLQTRARTSAGIYKIAQPDIISALIPVPPLLEQKAIIVALDEADREIQRIENSLNLGFTQSAAQRKNILKSAFSGQLVPQDPNDEPASMLLERIRAERAASDSDTRKRGSRKKVAKL